MNRILIDCSKEITDYLIGFLNKLKIKQAVNIDHHTLVIKEISQFEEIEQIKKLKEKTNCKCICIINDSNLIFEAIAIHPLNIWRKKYIQEDSQILKELMNLDYRVVEFQSGSNSIIVATKDIIYIESYQHYLTVHTINASFKIRMNISKMLQELADQNFIQVHRSYIINKNYLLRIEKKYCFLINEIEIPIGRKYQKFYLS
ncbi:MAG: LytR/AlgR family response regulator transcription factor [Thomasclavelia sp.]